MKLDSFRYKNHALILIRPPPPPHGPLHGPYTPLYLLDTAQLLESCVSIIPGLVEVRAKR